MIDLKEVAAAIERVSVEWRKDHGVQVGDITTILAAARLATSPEMTAMREASFQARVKLWMNACFGPVISADKLERNDRFIEEALELTQATGYTADRAHALVDYVFSRPVGEINQEVGGCMVTLAAHCLAHGVDMHEAGETELARIWTKVEQIRGKQAAKPTGSALPIAMTTDEIKAAIEHMSRYADILDAEDLMAINGHKLRETAAGIRKVLALARLALLERTPNA